MKLAVFSDLHLSEPGPTCAFTWDEPGPFVALVEAAAREHDAVWLAGDVWDLDVGARWRDHAGELERARRAWAPIADALAACGAVWVWGNHDAHLAHEGVPEEVRVTTPDGTRLAMFHGHQGPRSPRAWGLLKDGIKWWASRDLREGSGRIGRLLYAVNGAVDHPNPAAPSAPARAGWRWLSAHDDADVLIGGHTHIPRVDVTPGGVYINAGACSFGRADWVSLDTQARRVVVHDALTGSQRALALPEGWRSGG